MQEEPTDPPEMKRNPISRGKRFRILARDSFRCRYCGATAEQSRLQIDHLIPLCDGGDNDDSNLVAACEDCNSGKKSQHLDQLVDRGLAAGAHEKLAEIANIVDQFKLMVERYVYDALWTYGRHGGPLHPYQKNGLLDIAEEEKWRIKEEAEAEGAK